MPGITGISGRDATQKLPELERELYSGFGTARHVWAEAGSPFACAVVSRHAESGILERDGTVIAFEGWLFDPPAPLLPALLDRFLERGPAFVESLAGSFQLAVYHRGTTLLATDPVGSRRLFFRADGPGIAFSTEVAPLARGAGGGIDLGNLVQFLVSGRFFAGGTLLPEVRQLLPGEILLHRAEGIERRRYFALTVTPAAEGEAAERVAGLRDLLERTVARFWARALSPVFLLSGGYDSRYLYEAVARQVADPAALRSALWGERMDEPGSDNWTARQVAARRGARHRTLPWRATALPEQFEEMFRAHSGMTEMVFTHADELAVFRTLAEDCGHVWALRADECFGPKGEGARTADEALAQVSMSRVDRVHEAGRWLRGDRQEACATHRAALADLLGRLGSGAEPDDLRDTLYGRERLAAFLQHHNYHKLHFLEVANPFLDPEVLRFWGSLPRALRTGKALFCRCYHESFGDAGDPPIARTGNGVDWPAALRREPPLAAWVRAGLEELPPPLEPAFFLEKLDQVLSDGGPADPPIPPGRFVIPPIKLVARAFVLGHWLRAWG